MPNEIVPVKLRASLKMVKAGYVLTLVLAMGIAVYVSTSETPDARLWWAMAIPAALGIYFMIQHLQRGLTFLAIENGRLHYESGLLSKSTRTIELSKLQDVRVDQTLSQRLMKIGDLSIESAGSASSMVIHSIDRPQEAADRILDLARGH